MPIENEGNPTNWTLRFKHGRLTILLFSDPVTPFSILKDELLSVLRERYPRGLPKPAVPHEYLTIPDSIEDVALAVPIDQHDMTKGWDAIESNDIKGKAKSSPKSKGLKDGGALAFRFRSEDEEEEDDGDGGGFVVEWPSYDDNYGEQVEQEDKIEDDQETDEMEDP